MSSSGVNNTETFDAEPRILVIDAEPRLSFSEEKIRARADPRLPFKGKKTSPSRDFR